MPGLPQNQSCLDHEAELESQRVHASDSASERTRPAFKPSEVSTQTGRISHEN